MESIRLCENSQYMERQATHDDMGYPSGLNLGVCMSTMDSRHATQESEGTTQRGNWKDGVATPTVLEAYARGEYENISMDDIPSYGEAPPSSRLY